MQTRLEEIDKEIESISLIVSQTPGNESSLRALLTRLGKIHDKRYDLLQKPNDIHKMIEYTSTVLTMTPEDDPSLQGLCSDLGIAHFQRFQRLGQADDIQKTVEYSTRSLSMTPREHPDFPRQLANLAVSHKVRFELLGELRDIEKAIQYDSLAVELTTKNDSSLPERLEQLGISHLCRFQRFGELSDLEKAIVHQSSGLTLVPDDHPRLAHILANCATSHNYRFNRLGELSDLEKSIEYQCRALSLTPDSHPDLPSQLANLAVSHKDRFQRLDGMDDLEKAIEYESRALHLTPDDHPDFPDRLANLAGFHNNRFERLGAIESLEKASEYGYQAVSLTPDSHPGLSMRLGNVAMVHQNRFRRLGELDDIDKAIEYASRALAATPDNHPYLSIYLNNLALSHSIRFERLGDLDDLTKALEHGSRALSVTPENHPHLSIRLANLAISHKHRFERLGEPANLEKAIEYESHALSLTHDDHPDLPTRLAHLSGSYTHRFRLLGRLNDLEKAIEYISRALAIIPSDHSKSCLWHLNYAVCYVLRHEHSNDVSSSFLQQSLRSFRISCTSLAGAPRSRFINARLWATHASRHISLDPIEAYQTTINLLPQFIWLGATTDQRYADLKMIQTLAVDAAYAAILSSKYAAALEWLEHTRCIVWNQNLMLRSPLDQLQGSYPSFASRLRLIADQLHTASSNSRESQAFSSSTTPEQVGREHRRLAEEYNNLLSEVRTLPGFEDFLKPLKAHRLVHAAKSGPIVVINCHRDRCDALLILPRQTCVNHIPLLNFNGFKAQNARSELQLSVQNLRLGERGAERRPLDDNGEQPCFESVLAVLWYDVVKPILDFLGYVNDLPLANLPHITWCPTGAMSFLPLHAAGDYDQPRSKVFNYVISSYTPTLTALLESTPYSLSQGPRVLAIGQAATPGHAPLPGAALELNRIKTYTESRADSEYTQLVDEKATVTTVLNELKRHDWVHFACHARQNVTNATESGLFLHDGILDLALINRQSLKGKGLAFLSACQTATGDKELPDEAVHLASSMLTAGFTSVIATMWSVHDKDAPLVADEVYSQLMKDGKLGNGEAGKALHNGVTTLRGVVGEKAFARWVPFIHIGS